MPLELAGVFAAGLLTFFTPCILPLVPVFLAALVGGDARQIDATGRSALVLRALLFASGFVGTFTLLGLTATAVGGLAAAHRGTLLVFGGVLILLFALRFLGVIEVPAADRVLRAPEKSLGSRWAWLSAVLMGVVFAAGWSPCVGPVLGSVLTYTASHTTDPAVGAGYLAIYGVGLAVPMVLVAAFAGVGLGLLKRLRRHIPILERSLGALLLAVAVGMLLEATAAPAPAAGAPTPVAEEGRGEASRASAALAPAGAPAMLELYASDCPVCQQMAPIVESLTRDCQRAGRVQVRTVDVGDPRHRHLIAEHRLVGVPTFIFFDEAGAEVARLVGRQPEETLRQVVTTLQGQRCDGVGPLPEPAVPSDECDCEAQSPGCGVDGL